ncbi:MAG: pseudouridine synthase [Lachnospiraceae bacterium]
MVRWSADDIIYEDEQILVCRKHSGMAVQSARVGQMDLESELRNYRNGNYIGIVQRLDQPVEGVLVFGKTPQATAWLNKQHQNGMMKKRVSGCFYRHTSKRKAGYLGGLSYKRRKNQYFTGDG